MPKVICISDTHNTQFQLPKGDILLHAGDHTGMGTVSEMVSALDWLARYRDNYKEIVIVNGNHDWLGERNPEFFQSLCDDRKITYIENRMVEVDGLKIWGSSWNREFHNWAFNKTMAELEEHWKNIPEGVDIILTHEPPHGILDYTLMSHMHIGCHFLLNRVLEIKPKLHVYGHNHGEGGKIKEFHGIKFCNAAMLDERYIKTREPLEIEL